MKDILARAVQRFSARRKGDQWIGVCPNPSCGHHSLSLSEGDKLPVIGYCFREEKDMTAAVLEAVSGSGALAPAFIPPKRKRKSHNEEELYKKMVAAEAALEHDEHALAFLRSRGISIETAQKFRLGAANYPGCPGKYLVIPYFDDAAFRDQPIQIRYRQLVVPCNPDGSENKANKWRCDKTFQGHYRLFNLPLLHARSEDSTDPLVITESELDCMMVDSLGVAALSVDSAGHKLTEEDRTLLLAVKNLFLAFDQDEEGFECTKRFMLGLPYARMISGYGQVAKDLGDLRKLLESQGKNLVEKLQELFVAAQQEQEKKPTFTDAGNGERFVRRNRDIVRHCKQRESRIGWFVWNGVIWRPDAIGMAMELARQTIADILAKAGQDLATGKIKKEEYEQLYQWGMRSLSHHGLTNMLAQAGAGTTVCIDGSVFDSRPELLNLQNGTYNLETGEFYRARKEDLLTQVMNVSYDPSATCPLWMRFIDGVTQGDHELAEYLQRIFGYLLTGSQREAAFFLIYGPGGTGKSTYWKTIKGMMGDYFAMVSPGTFLKKSYYNRPGGSNATPNVAALVGKRVAATVEMEEGDKFDSGLIKMITGGDALTARPLYQAPFTFQPQCKPVFLVNHMPGTDDFSGGMEQRIRIVKFERVFRGTADEIKDLDKQLEPEYPGILNWALAGLEAWQESDGLLEPQIVKDAVKDYIADENVVARWLKTECVKVLSDSVPVADAFAAYKQWAENNGEFCKSERWFGLRMKQLGYKSEVVGRLRSYFGIQMVTKKKTF